MRKMRSFKRIFAVLVIFGLLVSCLSGCDKRPEISTKDPFESLTENPDESKDPTESGESSEVTDPEDPTEEPGTSFEETDAPTETEETEETPQEPTKASYNVPLLTDAEGHYYFDRSNCPTPEELHEKKVVYLTFDDGPSDQPSGKTTKHLLDILDEFGVKATFFVIHQHTYNDGDDKLLREMLKNISDRGHAIGIHAYNHRYEELYSSFDYWKADFMRMYNIILDVTGKAPEVYRFPGGSLKNTNSALYANWVEVKPQMVDFMRSMGVEYFDWNVITEGGDASLTREQIMDNEKDGPKSGLERTLPVILSHDGEWMDVSVETIRDVLKLYLDAGYEFRTLDLTVPPIQQGSGRHWDY